MPNKLQAEIAYPNYPLSLAEGEQLLTDAIRQFHGSIVQARRGVKAGSTPLAGNVAIKAAAGLGKTSQVISELCVGQVKYQKEVYIEYYVPTHNLSTQLVNDLTNEYQIHAERISKDEQPSLNVSVLKGRLQTDATGNLLCKKSEQVTELVNLGYPVSSRLCKSKVNKCEYYASCAYQKQFHTQEVDTQGITLPAVTVMTHHQLFLERHAFLPKPDFVVVDESFYQAGIDKIEIQNEVLQLVTSSDGNPSPVLTAFRQFILDGKPLLTSLRELGVTKKDLLEEADKYTFKELVSIKPNQTAEEQAKHLKTAPKYLKFDYILTALAEELETQQRDDSYVLHVDTDNGTKLVFMQRKKMNLPNGVPVLFIDADLNGDVIKLFRPDTKVINIPVERQATVHQFNKTLSAYSRKKEHSQVTEQIHTFLNLFKADKKALIVTTKKLRQELITETENEIKQTGLYGKSSINHYGNLRGLNEFENYKTVVVMDRNQPNNVQLEQTAMALWFDSGISITTCKDVSKTTYPMHQSGLRMKNHSMQNVKASYHPDKYVQILLEINREAEITQAIDRLRLLRSGSNNHNRQVFIATSVPVDITVDYYWDWNLLHRLLKLFEISVVVPLHPEHFLRIFPEDTVKTKRGAQDLIKNLNNTLPLIRLLISNYVLFKYKHAGSRKSAKALISKYVNPKDALEMMLGVEVLSVETEQ